MNKLDSYLIHSETMMTKNKRRRLATEQDVEAALQLIQLKDYHPNIVGHGTRGEGWPSYSDLHLSRQIHEPFTKIVLKSKELPEARDENHHDNFMKMVLKSKEFLQARGNTDKKHISNSGYKDIRKRKSDGNIASCSSSITFDLDDNSHEDANAALSSVKKMKKFRSIGDIYNVTKPL